MADPASITDAASKHQLTAPPLRDKLCHPKTMNEITTQILSIRAKILLKNPSVLELGSSVRRYLNMKAADQFDRLKRRYPGARFLCRDKRELWLGFVRMQLIRVALCNDGGQQTRHGGDVVGVAMADVWSYIIRDFIKGIYSALWKVLRGVGLKQALEKLLDGSAKKIDGYARAQQCERPGRYSKRAPGEGSPEVNSFSRGVRGNSNAELIESNSFAQNLRRDTGYDSDDSARSNGMFEAGLSGLNDIADGCTEQARAQGIPSSKQPNLRRRHPSLGAEAQNPGVSVHQQPVPTQPALSRQSTGDRMRMATLEVRGPMLATLEVRGPMLTPLAPTGRSNERPLSSHDYATRINLHDSQGGPLGNSSFGGPTFQPPQSISSAMPQPPRRELSLELIPDYATTHSTVEQPRMYPAPGAHSSAIGRPYASPRGEHGRHSYSTESAPENGNGTLPECGAFQDPDGLYGRGL